MTTSNNTLRIRTGDQIRALLKQPDLDVPLFFSLTGIRPELQAEILEGKAWPDSIPEDYHKGIDNYVVLAKPSLLTVTPPQPSAQSEAQPSKKSAEQPAEARADSPIKTGRPVQSASFAASDHSVLVDDKPITFSVVTKGAGSLSKQLYLSETGELVKDSTCCWLSEGTIRSYSVTLAKLAEDLSRLESNQALVLTNRHFKPNTRIVSSKQRQDGAVTRTRKDMQYVEGEPALLLLDADPSANYRAASTVAFIKDCASFMPGLEGCAYVATHSTSSWISKNDGTALTKEGGLHVYVAIKDAGRLRDPAVLKQLRDRVLARAWNAGKGELFIDRAGRAHRRCILDVSVWQPERLSFEGPPKLGEGLMQNRPAAEYRDGAYLDLEALLGPLTWEEQQQYASLVEETTGLHHNEIQSRRQVYIDTEGKKLTAQGLSEVDAKETLHARMDDGVIKGNQTLHLHQPNQDIPAWEVLAKIGQYNGAYLADPLEPDYGAAPGGICRTKAQIHDDGPRGVTVWSFAHGGRAYRIEHTEATLRKHLELLAQNQPEQFKRNWAQIAAATPLSGPERDTLCHWLKTLDPIRGARVASIRDELNAALELKEAPRAPAHDTPDLGDAERDPADIRREYAEQCQHLIDDPDLLGTLVNRVHDMEVVGEDHIIRGVYLAANSPLLGVKHNVHVIVRGQSSTGKSHVVTRALRALPEDCVEEIIGGSEKSLHYAMPDEFVERILYLEEANRLVDSNSDLVVALRTLLTKGRMVYQTVEKDSDTGSLQTVKKQLNGPMSFITTTTMMWIDEEMETRLLSLDADESAQQTRKIVRHLGALQGHPAETAEDCMADFHAFRKWLELGPRTVVLDGWTVPLTDVLPDDVVRIRRDYRRLESLAMVSALINQQRRPRTSKGYIVATLADYAVARDIIDSSLKRTVGANLPEETNDFVTYIYGRIDKELGTPTAVRALLRTRASSIDDPTSVSVSTRELATALGISQGTVRRRIATLIDLGVLHRLDSGKRGRPMQLALGDLDILCQDVTNGVLPTPEQLAAMMDAKGIDELAGTET